MKNLLKILRENGLPEKAAYFLLGIMFGIETNILEIQKAYVTKMFKLGFLYFKDGKVCANIDFGNTEVVTSVDKESDTDKFRKLFKGIKIGSMGDANAVFEKLQRWRNTNKEYSFEEILFKTKQFIEYKKSVNEEKYIPQADYFIYKKDSKGEEKSTLSSIIDEEFVASEQYCAV
jgi:hypothetical protein